MILLHRSMGNFSWKTSHLFLCTYTFFSVLCVYSGAAATPDGPAPKGMLANYTVLLTTVPPPTPAHQPSSPAEPSPRAPHLGWSLSHGSGGPVVAAPAARVEEADVRDALVDRDMGESIVCRRRYRILPDFSPGDRPYVVSAVFAPRKNSVGFHVCGMGRDFAPLCWTCSKTRCSGNRVGTWEKVICEERGRFLRAQRHACLARPRGSRMDGALYARDLRGCRTARYSRVAVKVDQTHTVAEAVPTDPCALQDTVAPTVR